ncbi:MAG: phosphodiester glycosidase family protein [Clostridia bacterium]|nr:phosphodiester glycosidase family protein [Clostridia bacterium]
MQSAKRKFPVWALILIDIFLLAICLSVFCYFHHIRDIWGSIIVDESAPEITEPPLMVITRPPRPSQVTVTTTTPDIDPTPDNDPPSDPDISTPDPKPVTTEKVPEVTVPPLDTSGDFGYLHAEKFAQGDEIIRTEEDGVKIYQSHDVYIEMKEVVTQLEQATKQGGAIKTTTVRYCLEDIYVRNIDNLFTSYSSGNKSFNSLLEGTNSIVAISGDVFNLSTEFKPIVIRNGNVIRKADSIKLDICALYWDGTMETITPSEYSWDKLLAKAPYQVWSFGPELLNDDGSPKSIASHSLWEPHPRSAIGYVEPGHYVLLVVDGQRGSNGTGTGINLDALAKILSEAGCKQAYNLDGGTSVYGYYDGEMTVYFDKYRKISDIICIGEIG